MLFTKKVKHRKWQRDRKDMANLSPDTRGVKVSFGSYGLKATTSGRIKSNQIEAGRKAMQRYIGKMGRVWIRIFPDRPYTAKPAEMGMGKGKGDLQGYCVEVRPGRVLYEVDGVAELVAREGLRKAGTKLPVNTRVVARK